MGPFLHALAEKVCAAMTPANLARAAVEGMLCGPADGVDAPAAKEQLLNAQYCRSFLLQVGSGR